MKFLVVGLVVLGLVTISLPLLVAAVVATEPWLAVGALNGSVQVVMPPPTATPAPLTVPFEPALEPSTDVVDLARAWLGVPYAFGGCSRRGVDCSCLVQLVYRAVGVNLPRVAADQFNAVQHIASQDLVPGDLVFFANTYMPGISHVGIYIGGGQQINAPTEGENVSIAPVFTGYWGAHFAGAGRVEKR